MNAKLIPSLKQVRFPEVASRVGRNSSQAKKDKIRQAYHLLPRAGGLSIPEITRALLLECSAGTYQHLDEN